MSTRLIRHIREQILCRRLVMAHLHSTDEQHPLTYWQEVDQTWIQALQLDEWMQWRTAMLEELTMLGSIGRSITTFPDDPEAEYYWSFFKLFRHLDDIKYKTELRLSISLCCQRGCPIPIIRW